MVRVGEKAPDFKTKAYVQGKIKPISMEELQGRWVVLCFYPGDFTFVWPTEISSIAVRYPELQELGVDVLSVSVDSVFSHKIWEETELSKMIEGPVPFPMLTDPGGRIGSLYGVYDEKAGVNVRGRFLIDPDGIIQSMEILSPPVGRNTDELIRQIKAYQHNKNTGEVIPAAWQPGDPTLKPSTELAGNVWKVWKPKKD